MVLALDGQKNHLNYSSKSCIRRELTRKQRIPIGQKGPFGERMADDVDWRKKLEVFNNKS
jgi:hypothetical protein